MSDAQKPLNEDGLSPDPVAGTPDALESEHSDASSQAVSEAPATPAPLPDPVAAAPIADNRRKVWSDDGDIPFDDGDRRLGDGGEASPGDKDGGNELLEIIKTVVFALLIALVLRTLLF
ncbi:MAG: hypothetical protein ACK58O_12335, partial [Brevundimonas sp.]